MVYSYFRNPDAMHWSIKSWLGALLCVLIMQRHAAVAQVDISTKQPSTAGPGRPNCIASDPAKAKLSGLNWRLHQTHSDIAVKRDNVTKECRRMTFRLWLWVVIRGSLGCRLDAVIQWCRWWLPSASALIPNQMHTVPLSLENFCLEL